MKVLGCDAEECLPDKDILNETINYVGFQAIPNLISSENEVIKYSQDMTFFKYLDPARSQSSNIFFMKSDIKL